MDFLRIRAAIPRQTNCEVFVYTVRKAQCLPVTPVQSYLGLNNTGWQEMCRRSEGSNDLYNGERRGGVIERGRQTHRERIRH